MSTKNVLFAAVFFQSGIVFTKFNDCLVNVSQWKEFYMALVGLGMCIASYLFYSFFERKLTKKGW